MGQVLAHMYFIFMHSFAFALKIEVLWPGGSVRAMAVSGVPCAVWKGKGRNEKPHTRLLLIARSSGESGLRCVHPRDLVTIGLFGRLQSFWRTRLNSLGHSQICKT